MTTKASLLGGGSCSAALSEEQQLALAISIESVAVKVQDAFIHAFESEILPELMMTHWCANRNML